MGVTVARSGLGDIDPDEQSFMMVPRLQHMDRGLAPSSGTFSSFRIPVPLLHSVAAAPPRGRPGACSNTVT